MILTSRTKHLLAASALGVAALTMSLPAEARMGWGGGGHMGHMGGFGGPFAAGLIGGAALGGLYGYGGYGYPYGGYYSASYGGGCYLIRRRVYSPWGPAIRKQWVCDPIW